MSGETEETGATEGGVFMKYTRLCKKQSDKYSLDRIEETRWRN
jgi:hypothetical protein